MEQGHGAVAAGEAPNAAAAALIKPPATADAASAAAAAAGVRSPLKVDAATSSGSATSSDGETEAPTTTSSSMDTAQPPDEGVDQLQPEDELQEQQEAAAPGVAAVGVGGSGSGSSIVDCEDATESEGEGGGGVERPSAEPAAAAAAAPAVVAPAPSPTPAPVVEAVAPAAAAVPMETEEEKGQGQQEEESESAAGPADATDAAAPAPVPAPVVAAEPEAAEATGMDEAESEEEEEEEAEAPRAPNGLTIAEAEEYLAAALACTEPGKRMKLVGKGLVAFEATHAALGTSPEALASLTLHQQAAAAVAAWRAGLATGAEVDAQSFRDDKWYAGALQEGGADEQTGEALWVVKFKRFSVKHNEAYAKVGEDTLRFVPVGSHTAPLKGRKPKAEAGGAKKRPRGGEQEESGGGGGGDAGAASTSGSTGGGGGSSGWAVVQPELHVVGTTRSGRAVKSVAPAPPPKPPAAKKQKRKAAAAGADEKEAAEDVVEEGEGEGGAGTAVDTEGKDFNDWVCGVCDELERSDQDRLVLCDGPCHGAFHQSCLGLSSEEVDAMAEWFCEQCREGEHTCFVCGDTGKDDGANGGVHKCGKPHCGKFYHQHCVSQLPHAQIARDQEQEQGADDAEEEGVVKFKFTCPLHTCDLCGKGRESGSRSQLYPCWHCPRAYHANCIPPTSKYHEYLLLCPDHAHLELPHLPGWEDEEDGAAGGEQLLGGEAAAALAAGKGEDGWLAGVLCALLPRGKGLPFRLPRSTFAEVNSKPRPYSHIPCIKYLCKVPPAKEPGPECQCEGGACDERCLNRILHIECIGGGNGKDGDEEEGGGGGGNGNNGKKEKYHNCNAGPGCGNRQFRNKEYIKHQIFKEGGCGWGLRTLEDVKKGQLVFEYVGEVIDDDLLERRLQEHARDHPNDHNMYIMELESGYYLDARVKGNASRFINHSCAPNCELQRWIVKGFTHIGIMANQDIPAGTPLSYDYMFATNEEGKFKCHCGAKTCRGSLAPKPKYSEDEEMEMLRQGGSRTDRKKLLELCKKRKEREAARREQQAKASALKKNHTSHLLPGDPLLEVRAGPPAKYFPFARAAGIFLVRNVKAGNDFLRRTELLGVAKAAALAAPAAEGAGVGAEAAASAGRE